MDISPEQLEAALTQNRRMAAKLCPNLAEDLVGVGHLAITHAMRSFDPSKGANFTTYSAYWIRAYQRREFVDISVGAHVPKDIADSNALLGDRPRLEIDSFESDEHPLRNHSVEPEPGAYIDVREAYDKLNDKDKELIRRFILEGEPRNADSVYHSVKMAVRRLRKLLLTPPEKEQPPVLAPKPKVRRSRKPHASYVRKLEAIKSYLGAHPAGVKTAELEKVGFVRRMVYNLASKGEVKLSRGLVTLGGATASS